MGPACPGLVQKLSDAHPSVLREAWVREGEVLQVVYDQSASGLELWAPAVAPPGSRRSWKMWIPKRSYRSFGSLPLAKGQHPRSNSYPKHWCGTASPSEDLRCRHRLQGCRSGRLLREMVVRGNVVLYSMWGGSKAD